ncbi:hemolysin family protein [Yinghuangia seranimata]|uniref:hemolysin family protein n=1 Tax=Yinghuangia seranimata TaxID=408067 RepID=UPI00248ACA58|nr:hemolysin family protein [Yinghuangia seranimata]MDI2129726.1 hemolysin family protein [Yinghuangia seranimata]
MLRDRVAGFRRRGRARRGFSRPGGGRFVIGSLVFAVFLLMANALFVGAEFALISARRTRIEPRAEEGSRRARIVLRGMEQLSVMLAGAQLGITVASLALGAVAEPAVEHLLEGPARAAGIPHGAVRPLAFAVGLAIVVFCHMVLGEMVPKNIALAGPEECAMWLTPPLWVFSRVTAPVLWILGHVANLCLRLVRIDPVDEVRRVYTVEELPAVLAESREHDLLDKRGHGRLEAALTLQSRTAEQVMRPWIEVLTLASPVTGEALEHASVETGRSRFPVVDDGRVTGYVHVHDTLDRGAGDAVPVYPLLAVRPDATLSTLLARMRAGRTHLAVVQDADGTIAGLASLDDVLAGFLA